MDITNERYEIAFCTMGYPEGSHLSECEDQPVDEIGYWSSIFRFLVISRILIY